MKSLAWAVQLVAGHFDAHLIQLHHRLGAIHRCGCLLSNTSEPETETCGTATKSSLAVCLAESPYLTRSSMGGGSCKGHDIFRSRDCG